MSAQYIKQAINNTGAESKTKAQEGESFKAFISTTGEEGDFETKRNDHTSFYRNAEQSPYDLDGESLW